MTVYKGFDVLDLVQHNREGDAPWSYIRRFSVKDNGTGVRTADTSTFAPTPERSLVWMTQSREESQAMIDFIRARKGRAIPFWVPSFQRNLRPALDIFAAATQLTIRKCGYTAHLFPGSNGRR